MTEVKRDSQGRRQGKRVLEVTTSFLSHGASQLEQWFKENLVSTSVIRDAVKELKKIGNASASDNLQSFYDHVCLKGRGGDIDKDRRVVADRRGDGGPTIIAFAVDKSGARQVWNVKPDGEGGFHVTQDKTSDVPAKRRRDKKTVAQPTA